MSRFPVSPEKEAQLLQRMSDLDIKEEDIIEKFIRGSGKGGQKINRTASCVYLMHHPTGIEVKCQNERSQAMNRFYARRELCDKVEALVLGKASREQQEREKIRRQKRRRSRRAKEKILNEKRKTSKKKQLRQSPDETQD